MKSRAWLWCSPRHGNALLSRIKACGPGIGRQEQGRQLRCLRADGHGAHRWAQVEGPGGLTPRRPGRCAPHAGPARTWSRPGSWSWTWRSRREWPVHQACQRDQPGILAQVPDRSQGRVAVPGPPRRGGSRGADGPACRDDHAGGLLVWQRFSPPSAPRARHAIQPCRRPCRQLTAFVCVRLRDPSAALSL